MRATVGYDAVHLLAHRDGVLVGYQLDRSMGHLKPELNDGRSNGCAYADSAEHVPLQRMANVSLRPDPDTIRMVPWYADPTGPADALRLCD